MVEAYVQQWAVFRLNDDDTTKGPKDKKLRITYIEIAERIINYFSNIQNTRRSIIFSHD